jgi:hypothetical protein
MKTLIVSAVLSFVLLAGCGADQSNMPGPGEVTETAVHLNPDGTETVTTRIIKEGATSGVKSVDGLAQRIGSDSACAAADMWLYDGTNLTGNRICFFGAGTVQLGNYQRLACFRSGFNWTCAYLNWGQAVRSYYSGNSGGYFRRPGDIGNTESFGTLYLVANAGIVAQASTALTLYSN